MPPNGPSLPRRMLGRQMRTLREKSGVSAEFAREAIGVGKQTLWRMETGQPIRLNPLFIEKLCQVYGASDKETETMLGLTEETKKTGWWHALDDSIPEQLNFFVELEASAKRLISYQSTLLPGLLQTAEYRRALIWVDFPAMPGPGVERFVEWFSRRKSRMNSASDPLSLEAVIDESALRRAIGGPAVMARQLEHLAEVGERTNISIRVVPHSAEAYGGLRVGPFVIMEFPPHPTAHLAEPPVVYIQGFTGDLYLEKGDEVIRFRQAYASIEHSALDEDRSRALIRRIAKEYIP